MKRAFLVTGPESAGNRLLAAVLSAAGCVGEGSTASRFNERLPFDEDPAVVIRSMPHGGDWYPVEMLLSTLRRRGYEVTVLVTTRDPVALARSQVANGHQPSEDDAHVAVCRAYDEIFDGLRHSQEISHLVPYESVTSEDPNAIPALLELLGLRPVGLASVEVDGLPRPIENQNAKHYEVRT